MLEDKDFCDYDTCVALREIGCRIETDWYIHQPSYEKGTCCLYRGIPQETSVLDECDYIPRISLYEAQKWLRKHGVIVDQYNNFTIQAFKYYISTWDEDICTSNKYTTWEEALSDGIKEATKLIIEKRILID